MGCDTPAYRKKNPTFIDVSTPDMSDYLQRKQAYQPQLVTYDSNYGSDVHIAIAGHPTTLCGEELYTRKWYVIPWSTMICEKCAKEAELPCEE